MRMPYLLLDVPKVDAQLFLQRRLAVVPLGREGRQPPRPQTTLLAHAPRHAGAAAKAGAEAVAARRGAGVAVGCLRGGRVARHGLAVAGRVELEVLGAGGRVALVWRRAVVLRHDRSGGRGSLVRREIGRSSRGIYQLTIGVGPAIGAWEVSRA